MLYIVNKCRSYPWIGFSYNPIKMFQFLVRTGKKNYNGCCLSKYDTSPLTLWAMLLGRSVLFLTLLCLYFRFSPSPPSPLNQVGTSKQEMRISPINIFYYMSHFICYKLIILYICTFLNIEISASYLWVFILTQAILYNQIKNVPNHSSSCVILFFFNNIKSIKDFVFIEYKCHCQLLFSAT